MGHLITTGYGPYTYEFTEWHLATPEKPKGDGNWVCRRIYQQEDKIDPLPSPEIQRLIDQDKDRGEIRYIVDPIKKLVIDNFWFNYQITNTIRRR